MNHLSMFILVFQYTNASTNIKQQKIYTFTYTESEIEKEINEHFDMLFRVYNTGRSKDANTINKYLNTINPNPQTKKHISELQIPNFLKCGITNNILKNPVYVYFTHLIVIDKYVFESYKNKFLKNSIEDLFFANIKFHNLESLVKENRTKEFIAFLEDDKDKKNFYYITLGFTLFEFSIYERYISKFFKRRFRYFEPYKYIKFNFFTDYKDRVDQVFTYYGFSIPEKFLDSITYNLMKNPMKFPTCNHFADNQTMLRLITKIDSYHKLFVRCPFTRYYFRYNELIVAFDIKFEIMIFIEKAGIYGRYITLNQNQNFYNKK